MSSSSTLLCVLFLLLGIGSVTATAPAPAPTTSCIKVDGCALDLITSVFNRKISLSTQCCQGLSTISDDCFYREFTHSKRVPFFLGKVRNYCNTHAASSPSSVDNVAPPHTAPAPTTSCIKVDGCALDLITSVFNRKISLSTQCCQGLSTISDDCFYREFTHSKRVPFFLSKVRNYCNTHATSSPSPVDNAAPSPSSISPLHTSPASAPISSCINVKGCAIDLITSVFNRKISLSTQCCQGLSTISDDCFYREFTHSKRVPFFLGKVRNYCSYHV